MNARKMLVLLAILTFISFVNSSSICDYKHCVCLYKNFDNQDFVGDSIQCSYSDQNILQGNFTLPDLVHALDLSSNNISELHTSTLLESNTMVELFLNNNCIRELRGTFLKLPGLKRLDLSYNQLEYIDKETFKGVKNLKYLDIANNKFTTFTDLMFHHLYNLNEIILNNNNIGETLKKENLFDRSGFGLTNKIKSISISGIYLDNVPDNFFVDAYDLRKLIISNNNIKDIFELPYTLEYLDLSDNPITDIAPEDFSNVPAMKVLKLNNLFITEVPECVFEDLRVLKILEIERNKNLTVFSSLLFGRDALADADDLVLERLSLRGSRLTQLDKELMEPFGRLIELDLQGNPWQCDCNMKWVKKLHIPDEFTEHFRCGTPSSLYNAKIFDLKDKYFICDREKRHVGIALSIFTVCLILSVVAVWMFLCVPKTQTRGTFIKEMYNSTAEYTVLPSPLTLRDD